ncbi:MAG: lycopene cyclase domain-containing protein [Candidatus Omnitrophica bacterium]|nr:lycopene cyclase domain-containing protein [Candidatus Omnitrophota bacterium]
MAILLLSVSFPLLFSFYPALKFWRNLKALIFALTVVIIIFGSWDIFATWRGHWYFNPQGILGVKIVNLPLEEWLFFVVIPFCCIFTWEALKFIKQRIK